MKHASPARGVVKGQQSPQGPCRGWLPAVALLLCIAMLSLPLLRHTPSIHESKIEKDALTNGDGPAQQSRGGGVPLTLVQSPDGKQHGVCLDGTPPGYFHSPGTGAGSDKWIVFLEGGAWCGDEKRCQARRETKYGSTTLQKKHQRFRGILGADPVNNPDFYNWNRVFVVYCDGGSFAGTVRSPQGTSDSRVYLQGQFVWEAIMDDLLLQGMANASQALLAGASAGGLACMLHCDQFASLFPDTTTVKCLSDSGFFLDQESSDGRREMRTLFQHVTEFQKPRLNPKCLAEKMEDDRWQCLFPAHMARHISTPLFLLNSAYDTWQIAHGVVPTKSPEAAMWNLHCLAMGEGCSDEQINTLHDFRQMLLRSIEPLLKRKSTGVFLDSCFVHSQSIKDWAGPCVNNVTIREAVGDWFFDRRRRPVREIDCPFPCNPTCTSYPLPHKLPSPPSPSSQ